MIEQDGTSIEVRASLPAGAPALFAVLADPRRHREIDGSGMLRGVDPSSPAPLTAVGQIFTMEMQYPTLGEYRTENHIVEFEADRLITWTTGREGQTPAGVRWTWLLEPDGAVTSVIHRYDWSRVVDPAVLARVTFPRVSAEELQGTVRRLAAAATAS